VRKRRMVDVSAAALAGLLEGIAQGVAAGHYLNGLPGLVVVERRGMLVREAAAKGSGETEDSGSEESDG
jgi:hypothetical protein